MTESNTSLFERIGVRRAVNGVGPATRLGGLPLHSDVLDAMAQATKYAVRMDDLEDRAGSEIARLLGVQAAYVTSGAAAALTLATAALIAGKDPALIDSLPRVEVSPHKVIVLAAQRDPYDRALELAGAELVVVGYPTTTHLGEIERAIDDQTVAVLYRPGRDGNHPSLAAICELASRKGVPVLVDGALYAPPLENLHQWLADGAALVALSGGKHFRGPQASGILCGRADLIEFVGAQHQDMDERESTWVRGGDRITPPRHGVGRAMKVGREQIAGLLAAVESYIAAPGAGDLEGITELEKLRGLLAGGRVPAVWHETSVLGVPVIELQIVEAGFEVDAVVNALAARVVPVYLEEAEAWRGVLVVHPMALVAGDAEVLATAVAELSESLTEGDPQ